LAESLKVIVYSLPVIVNRNDVIGVKFDVQMRRWAAATGKTTESVSHENLEPKSGPYFSTIFLPTDGTNMLPVVGRFLHLF
jgi:hypothetical protein